MITAQVFDLCNALYAQNDEAQKARWLLAFTTQEIEAWLRIGTRAYIEALRQRRESYVSVCDLLPGEQRSRRNPYVELCYVRSGTGDQTIGSERHELSSGTVYVVPAESDHLLVAHGHTPLRVYEVGFLSERLARRIADPEASEVYMDFAWLEPTLDAGHRRPRLHLDWEERQEVEAVMLAMMAEQTRRPEGYQLMLTARLVTLLILLGRSYNRAIKDPQTRMALDESHSTVLESIRWLQEHHAEPLRSEQVARLFNISPSHYRFLLRQITGQSFTQLLSRYRIEQAMDLLRSTDRLISDIADSVGFQNYNHFSRLFRQQIGLAPQDWRRREREGHAAAGGMPEPYSE